MFRRFRAKNSRKVLILAKIIHLFAFPIRSYICTYETIFGILGIETGRHVCHDCAVKLNEAFQWIERMKA